MLQVTAGSDRPGLTIGEMAGRSGVTVAALRAWETRFGFPAPVRLPSGHRRYALRDVEMVRRVLREREAGYGLAAAIARARQPASAGSGSLYAELRRARPDLVSHLLIRPTMLAISRAIEDECCSQAGSGVLVGCFQTEAAFRASASRWEDLARTASAVLTFADFDRSRWRPGAPAEVPIEAGSAMRREWSVICDTPGAAACLIGVERPGQGGPPDRRRAFEAFWTCEPAVVRLGTRTALRLARPFQPDAVEAAEAALGADPGDEPPDPVAVIRRATALTNRIVGYLQATLRD